MDTSRQVDKPQRESVRAMKDENDDVMTSESVAVQQPQPTDVTAYDLDVLTTESLTLPRIEQVLRSEGVQPISITQQIDSLRKKVARYA